jgi:iron complex transport system ATP-binding protein
MIRLENVSKQYDGVDIVDNVSLDIPEGQVVSFIGANGAGKSTLFSLMSRLITQDSGRIIVDEKAICEWNNDELAQTLGILKQTNELHIRLRVRELVEFGRFPYSKSRLTEEDNKHVEHALAFMELTELTDKYLDELSGGQRQRVHIAMVLAQDTKYILLDEPLNSLDIKHSLQMMKLLRKMARELNKTILVIMHDINFSASYSDYIFAFKKGKKIYEGAVQDVIQSEVLRDIYDIEINVTEVNQCKVCLYS